MTGFALHVAVCAFQPERRPFVMIEERWLPFHLVVALPAVPSTDVGELLAVDIRVT